ncbi:MAG: SCO family protein [Thermomicrobiales bacterium]|nr:SCO family protein [Thermomicrobiales bacterium]
MDDPRSGGVAAARFGRRSLLGTAAMGMLLLAGCSRSNTKKLVGTDLKKTPAPDFALTDHVGNHVSLSDFSGRPVALSFIFTNCPDICPLIASQMRTAYDLLPEKMRDEAVFLGVSVDPERDTPDAMQEFTARFALDDVPGWHALWGSRDELEAVWRSYGIEATEIEDEVNSHINGSASVARVRHTDAIYLIDGDGNERVLMRANDDPQDLASNLEALS